MDYYNLDVIISIGYRVKSHRGTQFRQWANKVLNAIDADNLVCDFKALLKRYPIVEAAAMGFPGLARRRTMDKVNVFVTTALYVQYARDMLILHYQSKKALGYFNTSKINLYLRYISPLGGKY